MHTLASISSVLCLDHWISPSKSDLILLISKADYEVKYYPLPTCLNTLFKFL